MTGQTDSRSNNLAGSRRSIRLGAVSLLIVLLAALMLSCELLQGTTGPPRAP